MTPRPGLSGFAHVVIASVRRHGLFPQGARVLVALSGGPDSCALLLALAEAASAGRLPAPAGAAHFHHGLRGRDADDDAAFAAALCSRIGLPCVIGIGGVERAGGRSPNDAARRARYDFLKEAAHDLEADVIATAHTADDQAETVLGRILRGTSVDGLAGIPRRRDLGDGLRVVRPLLELRRTDVESYCASRGVAPRRDPANEAERYGRSRLRKRLPHLAADFNPHLTEALVRLSEHADADSDLLGRMAGALWEGAVRSEADARVELARGVLREAHPALRRRVLLRAIRAAAGESPTAEEAATAAFVGELEDLLPAERDGKAHDLPGGIRALARGDSLLVGRRPRRNDAAEGIGFYQPLNIPGTVRIEAAGRSLSATWRAPGSEAIRVRRSPVVDLALPDRGIGLAVRSARPGDRIAPLGMKGRMRLVRDVLAEAGVPAGDRSDAPLLVRADTGEILWVVGLAQSESTRVTPESAFVARLTAEQR